MNKPEQPHSVLRKACSWWAVLYILLIFVLLPLYVENNYFNLIEAKSHIFTVIAFVMLPVGIILFIITSIRKELDPVMLNIMDIMVISLSSVALISSLFSDNISAAFWGNNGWGIGAFAWICLAVSYLLIPRCLIYNHNIWLPIMAVNCFIIFIAILQSAGVDAFSMHRNMIPEQVFTYFSTIGNTNWWTGYICLFAPMTVAFLAIARTTSSRVIYLIFWCFISFALLICAADGLFLGLGFCAFFTVPLLFRDRKGMETFGWLTVVFGSAMLIYTLLPCFNARISWLYGMACKIYVPWVGAALLAVGCAVIILFRLAGDKIPDTVFKVILIIAETVLGVVAAGFLVHTILNYGNEWGTYRGKIWNDSMLIFRQFPLKNKLIGLGPEMLRPVYVWLSDYLGRTLKVAHSEPLQYLLSMGIAGAAAWYGIWISAFISFVRERKKWIVKIAFFLSLTAYFAQAHINSSMTTNMAILYMFFALFRMPEYKA